MPEPATPYDPNAIFDENGPIEPRFMEESIRNMVRGMPLDNPAEPDAWTKRRMYSAARALAALHPRDEIEVMLGVQALCAYHAATACWHAGMNLRRPYGDSTRHIAAAASAARTFDSLLKALERRQAKPLTVPIGRPAPHEWTQTDHVRFVRGLETRCRLGEDDPEPRPPAQSPPHTEWTAQDLAVAEARAQQERTSQASQGLDIANTPGILPDGGIIMPAQPTPQQDAYIARRLGLLYKRQHAENLRKGSKRYPPVRPLRTGDHIP